MSSIQDSNTMQQEGYIIPEFKNIIRPDFGSKYNHELLNGLFYHPYTKIDHVVANMQVSRQTASKYLDRIFNVTRGLKLGFNIKTNI